VLPAYLKILLARKPALAAGTVPAIHGSLTTFRIDPNHLARYRAICGPGAPDEVPIAYPHVLATPVHLAMVACDAFPLSLLGVVHVRNRIVLKRPLNIHDTGQIHAIIGGHRETPRGQELDLTTEVRVDGEPIWSETCTFLARRRGQLRPPRTGAGVAEADQAAREGLRTQSFNVDSSTGRRYAWVSGDFNPIHMANLTARIFGFKRAIAHGMWTLARCAAALGADAFAAPCTLDAAFKLPISFPARVVLESWSMTNGIAFALRDSVSERGHLIGSIQRS
jgi:acyl dehydratase